MFQQNFVDQVRRERGVLGRLQEDLMSQLASVRIRLEAADRLLDMSSEIVGHCNTLFGEPAAVAQPAIPDPDEPTPSDGEPEVADDPQPTPEPEPDVKKAEADPQQEDPGAPDPKDPPSESVAEAEPATEDPQTAPEAAQEEPAKRRGRPPKIPVRDYPAPKQKRDQEMPAQAATSVTAVKRVVPIMIAADRIDEVRRDAGLSFNEAVIMLTARHMAREGLNQFFYSQSEWEKITGIKTEAFQPAWSSLIGVGYIKVQVGKPGFSVPMFNPVAAGGYGVLEPASKEAILLGLIRRAQVETGQAMFGFADLEKRLNMRKGNILAHIRRLSNKGYITRGEGNLEGHIFLIARPEEKAA